MTGLDYGEDLHQLRILGKWSNMTGYELGSSPVGAYPTTKTSLVENFKQGCKSHGCQHSNTLYSGSSPEVELLGQTQTSNNILASREVQLKVVMFIIFPIVSTILTIASNNLVLDWNSRPNDALLHRKSKMTLEYHKHYSRHVGSTIYETMIVENRQLITNGPVEVKNRRKITDHFRRIYRIYPNSI